MSCDTEHLTSGRGEEGAASRAQQSTVDRPPPNWLTGWGEDMLRGTGSAGFLARAWEARTLLSQI